MKRINKLPENIINQISAGEVVEGPSSIIKELIENSLDAEATEIYISIKNGGLDEILIEDNGIGFVYEDIPLAFDSHTTSKIYNIEDLMNISTLGFRGEALASISSVSNIKLTTKNQTENSAKEIVVENGKKSNLISSNRTQGTSIKITNIFDNIPARKKFLRTSQTEYRKIVQVINQCAMIHPEIRFIFKHNNKLIFDYSSINIGETSNKVIIHPDRVMKIIGDKFREYIPVNKNNNEIIISGYVGHPSTNQSSNTNNYIYVNNRPIWDSGISKSVNTGMSRFIPQGSKVPFIIFIIVPNSQVDINVHPRKDEVRFLNPYRVYLAIESAVRESVEQYFKDNIVYSESSNSSIPRLRENQARSNYSYSFNNSPKMSSKDAIQFTKNLLEDFPSLQDKNITINQYLDRYLIAEKDGLLLIIDQHAAAERIRFESLLNTYNGNNPISSQKFLVPKEFTLEHLKISKLLEHIELFKKIGIDMKIDENKNKVIIYSIPNEIQNINLALLLEETSTTDLETRDIENFFNNKFESLIATISCHTSLRANQKISTDEAIIIYTKLFKCKNPYSCPHGRPIIWKLTSSEIDQHFNRKNS